MCLDVIVTSLESFAIPITFLEIHIKMLMAIIIILPTFLENYSSMDSIVHYMELNHSMVNGTCLGVVNVTFLEIHPVN